VRTASWYPKSESTYSDVLAAVRKRCWQKLRFLTGHRDPAYRNIRMLRLEHLINAAYYSQLGRTKSSLGLGLIPQRACVQSRETS
jgi:hypothetical protein